MEVSALQKDIQVIRIARIAQACQATQEKRERVLIKQSIGLLGYHILKLSQR
jgi:hypothetical protein